MTMPPRLRKFVLTVHIVSSVGWLGAVVVYVALAIAALTSSDGQTVRAAWLAMELAGWYVIVPLALSSVLIGIVNALGTPWGLFVHYWVLVKFLLTVFATIILLLHMPTVSYFAGLAVATDSNMLGGVRGELLHAGGGLLVLLVTTVLSVYKPRGMTRYGWRKQQERHSSSQPITPPRPETSRYLKETSRSSRRRQFVLIGIVVLVLLFIALHLAGGGLRGH